MMMSLKEIQDASAALGNQIQAGIVLSDAVRRMSRLQPRHAAFWTEAAGGIAGGYYLTKYLQTCWPETFVKSVNAGEETGTLPEVFARIEVAIGLQRKIQGMVWELAYPVGLGVSGIFVFVFFMTKVLPSLASSLGSGDHGFIFQLSEFMTRSVTNYWGYILLALAAFCVAAYYWINDSDNRLMLSRIFLSIPVLREGLLDLYFGLWAYYVALIYSSGHISIAEGLPLTSSVLPPALREGVELVAREVATRGLADSVDPERQPEGDPRRQWPFYIGNAFIVARETGELDKELLRVAPSLIKDGTDRIKMALQIANVVSLMVSALLIAGPLMAYYMQLGSQLQQAMH